MNINKIIVAATLVAMPLAASAQDNFLKAIHSFLEVNGDYITMSNSTNGEISYYKRYYFSMPANQKSKIETMTKAFGRDAVKAYSSYKILATKELPPKKKKDKGDSDSRFDDVFDTSRNLSFYTRTSDSGVTQDIAYGDDLSNRVSFGTYTTRNYYVLLTRDPKDSLSRYATALVWWKDGDVIDGSIHEIYSRDPQRYKATSTTTTTVRTDVFPDGSAIVYDPSSKTTRHYGPGEYSSDSNVSASSDLDFLKKFSNLRAFYLKSVRKQDDATIQTGIVNNIVAMCKQYSGKLSDEQKKVCISALDEMKKASVDSFLKSMFDLATQYLK